MTALRFLLLLSPDGQRCGGKIRNMRKLKPLTERNIQKRVGMDVDRIRKSSAEEVDRHIERKIGKKLEVAPPRGELLIGRGSPLLTRLSKTHLIDKLLTEI